MKMRLIEREYADELGDQLHYFINKIFIIADKYEKNRLKTLKTARQILKALEHDKEFKKMVLADAPEDTAEE